MKILSLEAYNKHNKLKISKIDFQSFTLLVGASGVGKTQILNAINNLRNIASGESFSGFGWAVNFEIDSKKYIWEGQYARSKSFEENELERYFPLYITDDDDSKPIIENEKLVIDGREVINRDSENIKFNGKEIVKLSPHLSAVSLLKQEGEISPVNKAFSQIVKINDEEIQSYYYSYHRRNKDLEKAVIESTEDIRNSEFSLSAKMYLCQDKFPTYFKEIVENYIDIFPFVEDIKVQRLEDETAPRAYSSAYIITVKERGIEHWISQASMSSGMLKTLFQIAFLHLSPNGTVFLIDEFENGFGVNCINDITDILMNTGNGVQFIITSHHPYIINNIPLDNWKIISRMAGVVKSYDADAFRLKESNHEAFTKLINLDVYFNGADR